MTGENDMSIRVAENYFDEFNKGTYKRIAPVIFLLDTSGSMSGECISNIW